MVAKLFSKTVPALRRAYEKKFLGVAIKDSSNESLNESTNVFMVLGRFFDLVSADICCVGSKNHFLVGQVKGG